MCNILFFPHCAGTEKEKKLADNQQQTLDSDWVTSVILIHNDGSGVQMPFSALSLSWETDCPSPSLLQPSLSFPLILSLNFIFYFFYYLRNSRGSFAPISDECLVSVFWSDTFNQIFSLAVVLHSNSGEEMPLSSSVLECLHLLEWSHLTMYSASIQCKENGLLCIVVPYRLYRGYNVSNVSL